MASGPEQVAELYIETALHADKVEQGAVQAERALERVEAAGSEAEKALAQVDTALDKVGTAGQKSAAGIEQAGQALQRAGQATSKARADLEAAATAIGGAVQAAQGTADAMTPMADRLDEVIRAMVASVGGSQELTDALRELADEGIRFGAITEEMSTGSISHFLKTMAEQEDVLGKVAAASREATEAEVARLEAYQKIVDPLEAQVGALREELALKQAIAAGNTQLAGAILQNRNARLQEEEVTRRTAKLNADEAEQVKLLLAEKYKLKTAIEQTTVAAGSLRGRVEELISAMGGRAVLSVGAFATAMVALTGKAMDAAREFRDATGTIVTASAALSGQLTGVTREIENVARATGRPLQEVASVGLDIARRGVDSLADFSNKLRLASDLAGVTGTAFSTVADGLQQIQDVFGITAGELGGVADQLYRISQTGKPLNELMAAIQGAAPTLREFGVGIDVAVAALAKLVGGGLTPRQAAQELETLARRGKEGREELLELAAAMPAVTAQTRALKDGVSELNDALGKDSKVARAEWDTFMVRWGQYWNEVKNGIASALNAINEFERTVDRMPRWRDKLYFALTGVNPVSGPARGPLTTAAPIVATIPRTGGTGGTGGAGLGSGVDTAAVRDADRALRRLQEVVDDLFLDIFPKATTALETWQEQLAEEIAVLEKGTKAQRERAEVLKALGEQYAKVKDVLESTTASVVGGNIEGGQLQTRQVDWQQQVRDLKQQQANISAADAKTIEAADQDHLQHLIEQGRQIDAAVQGALDLAAAFGLADDNIVGILSSLSRVATGIAPLQAALKTGSSTQILGAALPVVGGVASLVSGIVASFGDSPALKAAKEALERNTDILHDVSEGLRGFRLSGAQITIGRADLGAIEAGIGGLDLGVPKKSVREIEGMLRDVGVSMDELRELAGDLGLEFVELTKDTWPQFLTMLSQMQDRLDTMAKAGYFGTGASGRLDQAKARIAFSPEDETIGEQIQQYIGAAMGGSGPAIISSFFAGVNWDDLDSSDPEIRNAAIAMARSALNLLFEQFTSGGLTPMLLGDMSADEFYAFLETILGLIPDALEESAETIDEAVTTWADVMRALNLKGQVFDWSSLEMVTGIFEQLAALSPELAAIIGGFDLSTVDGMQDALEWLQDQFTLMGKDSIHGAAFATVLESLGLTMEDVASIVGVLRGALGDAADEAERLAAADRQAAEEAKRQAERNAAEQERRYQEEQRRAEQAHQEALRRIEEERRIREQLGSDTLRATKEGFGLFGVTNQNDQFAQIVAGYVSQAPIFRNLLQGDPRSAGDRAEMLQAIREFWTANPFGVASGNLSQDAVRSGVLELGDLIQRLNEVDVTTEGETQSFAINRSITELRGERLEGLLATGNIFLGRIADAIEAIRDAFPSFVGLTPPTLALSASGGSNIYNITLHLGDRTVTAAGLSALAESDIRAFASRLTDYLGLSDLGV